MTNKSILIVVGAMCALVVVTLFAAFVWPTRYRYSEMRLRDNVLPVRIDRISGRTEVLYPYGWKEISKTGQKSSLESGLQEFGFLDLLKVTGKASITSSGWFECDIYNGSDCELTEITVLITLADGDGTEVLSRKYRLTPRWPSTSCPPLKSVQFYGALGFTQKEGQKFTWNIVAAKGTKQ